MAKSATISMRIDGQLKAEAETIFQQLGMTTYNGPQANFTGYNPATNNPMAYNFFPTASTSGQG